MKLKNFLFLFFSLPFVGLSLGMLSGITFTSQDDYSQPIVGNVRTFEAAYSRWRASAERQGQQNKLVLGLGHFKGLSLDATKARGRAVLDLINGTLSVEVAGLPEGGYEVWLVHNRPVPGGSVKPEGGDRMIRAGALVQDADRGKLETSLDLASLSGFKLDLLVVVPEGRKPTDGGLLYAAPNVFQKLYYSESRSRNLVTTRLSELQNPPGAVSRFLQQPFRAVIPTLAYANNGGNRNVADLIAQGEKLFFEEKFHGNGRTCGTCHPADNNFTIDPAYIATLPKNDPLFVAEFKRELNSQENGGRFFEVPDLLRQFGLILLNVDGFDDLANKFVLRGVPHTLALGLSITPATIPPELPEKQQRTGWDGGGAFGGSGTLREFAIGAVRQHFTRTLDRIPGRDFRLPTDAELDAIEAFLLSLGRPAELDLSPPLTLTDFDANLGMAIFNDQTDGGGKCSFCHVNAGANHGFTSPGGLENANFDIGIEDAVHPADALELPHPRDGGFGTAGDLANGFGDGTFNTPSLVEAADTPPFFHNNRARTIEEAVAFYGTSDFNGSAGAARVGPIPALSDQTKINQVAAFLRVINALENIRSAGTRLAGALEDSRPRQVDNLLGLAIVDMRDAIRVLREVPSNFKFNGLHPTAREILDAAIVICETARKTGNSQTRDASIQAALQALEQARGEMVN